ncbi:hypothetical protein GJ368_22215 [Shigella boydii]|nr:hypothetical protein [Escherichia coli O157:H7]EFV7328266.1 hypothetical protein [Shigella flexneri]EFV7692156.1 hypothetical protein [Shigella boydii]EFB2723085.1 hypothetical protein [Escherichia coli O157:H7]EFW0368736.1 hypothetical protein [Shigella flexneri]
MICGPVQICWHKFCRCCDVKLRKISLYDHRLIMNAEEVLKHVDENTIGIVTTLGITCFYFCKADCVSVFKISVKLILVFIFIS